MARIGYRMKDNIIFYSMFASELISDLVDYIAGNGDTTVEEYLKERAPGLVIPMED